MSKGSKQYLIVVDDYCRGILGDLIPSLRYVEVEGMRIREVADKLVMVTPNPDGEDVEGGAQSESGVDS